jgi:hypothetical protein
MKSGLNSFITLSSLGNGTLFKGENLEREQYWCAGTQIASLPKKFRASTNSSYWTRCSFSAMIRSLVYIPTLLTEARVWMICTNNRSRYYRIIILCKVSHFVQPIGGDTIIKKMQQCHCFQSQWLLWSPRSMYDSPLV